jgi:hypothetical protein
MFDLHPDGERVALAPAAEAPNIGTQDRAVFVFNFFDELNRLTIASRPFFGVSRMVESYTSVLATVAARTVFRYAHPVFEDERAT